MTFPSGPNESPGEGGLAGVYFRRFSDRRQGSARLDAAAHRRLVAGILDRLAFSTPATSSAENPLQHLVETSPSTPLPELLPQLTAGQRRLLDSRVPPPVLAELLAISEESNAGFFSQSLFHWAQRQEHADHLNEATLVYGLFAERSGGENSGYILAGATDALRQRAAQSLDAVLGRGSAGPRVEFLLRRLAQQASEPITIVGMATGSAVFTCARTAILSRLLASPGSGFFTRGLAARGLASTAAFALEVPAFWGSTKGLQELVHPGSQTWDVATNLRELAGLGITLGGLKLLGAGTEGAFRLGHRPNPLTGQATRLTAISGLTRRVAPQAGMLGGIMVGHRIEEAVGLRPHLDGATSLIDSLGMLVQFNVGGRLSREAFPRLHRFNQELGMRSQGLDASTRSWRQELFRNWPRPPAPGLVEAWGSAGSAQIQVEGAREGMDRARESILQMTMDPKSGHGAAGWARERGIRADLPAELPVRTDQTPDDKFERALSPQEILESLQGNPVLPEITSRFDFGESNWSKVGQGHLGAAVGEALETRLAQIASHPEYRRIRSLAEKDILEIDFHDVPRLAELAPELQTALNSAAELMQITQVAIRTNQTKVLEAVREKIPQEHQETYQELLSMIRLLKGPRLVMPSGDIATGSEVLGPETAVLSHGAGAMSSLLKAITRQTRVGGRPWHARYFATDADPRAVEGIRRGGKNPVLPANVIHNYEGDIPIEAIYNRDRLATILFRTVRVQLLNVPSVAMDKMLSEDFIRHLPENAILVSAIGGLVEPRGGRPQLPYQFIRGRLNQYGRDDVEIVSMGGYIPADMLWNGVQVRINLSTREDPARKSRPRHAATEVAQLFAGENQANDFVEASVSHWDHSNNLGKVAKNVFTLLMGYRAGEIARQIAEEQAKLRPEDPRHEELRDIGEGRYSRARKEIQAMMRGLLIVNEGIDPAKANYNREVNEDFEECSKIFFDNAVEVFRRARTLKLSNATPDEVRGFLKDNVFDAPRDRRVATTRNPRYGLARALHERLAEMGLPYEYEKVGPEVTVEGLMSLGPIIRFFGDPTRDIERRRLPNIVYELHRLIFGEGIEVPREIPSYIRAAIEREPRETKTRGLQETLKRFGVNTYRLRQVLEGADDGAIATLNREIRRLATMQEKLRRDQGRGKTAEELSREIERVGDVLKGLEEAMVLGNPTQIIRSRFPIGPYSDAFIIERRDPGSQQITHHAYLRLELDDVLTRLTSLGMFLRSFPPEQNVQIEVRIPGATQSSENYQKLFEVEQAGREIVRAFQVHRSGSIKLSIDRKPMEDGSNGERSAPTEEFYRSLEPLARWILGRSEAEAVTRDEVRHLLRAPRYQSSEVLDSLVRETTGWVMLLQPSGGPVHAGIRAMLTRPEKSVLMGIYSGDRLVDTFSVYRHDAQQARILSHQVMRKFVDAFPGHPFYSKLDAIHYFNGLSLEHFIQDYREYAEHLGLGPLRVQPIALQSAPIEQALVGNLPEVNAAVLKLFLNRDLNPRQAEFISEAERLYELPPEQAHPAFTALAKPYLEEFFTEHRKEIEVHPWYRLYNRFGFLSRNKK